MAEISFDWCHKHWASRYVELAHSFGLPLGGGYYDIVDGKIVSIVDSDQYRRFLEEYHRLTAEGLVNIEGATQTDEQYNSNISGGKVGVFIGWAPYTYISDEELKSQYVPMPLVSAEGTTPRLQANLNGIRDMGKLPGVMFIVDPHNEDIAVKEARKLNIPIVAITDTNCDPDLIDCVIPGNDDAIRAVKLISSVIANAVIEANQGETPVLPVEEEGEPTSIEEVVAAVEEPAEVKEEE